jgi:hypothetical protein
MKSTHIVELETYLEDAIALKPDFRPLGRQVGFPAYLNNTYTFYEAKLWGKTVMLALLNERAEKVTTTTLKKQWENLRDLQPHLVLMALKNISPHDRKRLMRYGIPFVATNKQLFLPPLGIDIEEYWAATAKEKPMTQLGIVAQEILLCALYDPDTFSKNSRPYTIAKKMDLSRMHITRALRELEHYKCIHIKKRGKENHLELADEEAVIWQRILPMLQSPFKERRYFLGDPGIEQQLGFRISGEQALAEKTLLMEPTHRVVAYHSKKWKALSQNQNFQEIPYPEPKCVEVELWRYDPTSDLISNDNRYVDLLSLLISFKNHDDERIQLAIEELQSELPWQK